jgi:hypothetical protein
MNQTRATLWFIEIHRCYGALVIANVGRAKHNNTVAGRSA